MSKLDIVMRYEAFDSSVKATSCQIGTHQQQIIACWSSSPYRQIPNIVQISRRIVAWPGTKPQRAVPQVETNLVQTTHLLVIVIIGAATGGLPALAAGLLRLLGAGLEGAGRGLAALGGDLALPLVSIGFPRPWL
jgi:chemotaxis response regulator CheB